MQHDVLSGKRILLGVTGSIAAYKAADILRRLQERGAKVRVAMTRSATRFVAPLTFATLSGMPVLCDDECTPQQGSMIGHIEITDELDAALVAPATANCIGKLAAGIADDVLTSAFMAASCPVLVAPAMNDRMWCNPVLKRNIATLRDLDIGVIEPESGALACGSIGQGRLAETGRIIDHLSALLQPRDLTGVKILVTAGPTREYIDAVRFLSNPSTGKMGYALATAATGRGASVTLVSGPTSLTPPSGVRFVSVTSAADMHTAVLREAGASDIVIMAAAVSDFRPVARSSKKVKKSDAPAQLALEQTADILRELGASKRNRILVGFAAETDDLGANAEKKLREKNLDMIVANDILSQGSGFGADTNVVTIITRSGERRELPALPKKQVAQEILDSVKAFLNGKREAAGS